MASRLWHHAQVTSALLTAAAAGLLAVAARAGHYPFALAVLFLQVGLAVGWFRLAPVPSPRGSLALTLAAAVAADALLLAQGRAITVGPLAVVLAFAFIGAIIHELARRGDRHYLTASLAATITGCALVVLAATALAERAAPGGESVVVTSAAAVAAGSIIAAPPFPPLIKVLAGAVAGLAAGGVVGGGLDDLGAGRGIVLGTAAGILVASARYVVAAAKSSRRAVLSAAVLLPLAFTAPASYVIGRILVG